MRKGCYDCVRKHLAQAEVLMHECEQGYDEHGWLAVGHLAEAEAEIAEFSPKLSNELREKRLSYMKYLNTKLDPPQIVITNWIKAITLLSKTDFQNP